VRAVTSPLWQRPDLEWPFPIRDLGTIHAEFVGVLFTRDLLVDEVLANAGAGDAETRHPVNRIDGQAEAIGLIPDGQLQRRVDVALFLVAAHMDVVLTWPAVGEAVDHRDEIGWHLVEEPSRPISKNESD
jgi:hypothetical protein